MSTVEEIERVIEQLPSEDFERLAAWISRRRPASKQNGGTTPLRDHSAFLNSYAPEDEGLYEDGQGR